MTARRASFARVGLAVGLVLAACSGAARVPPGLPPPEYEQPGASPWPPADAGVVPLGDGAAYVERDGDAFDLVLVDGYDARGRVGALDTPAFYARAHARMTRGSILATNLLSRHRGVDASVARMREAFEGHAVALPPSRSGNVVVLASRGADLDLEPAALAPRARALREASGLDLAGTLSRLARSPAHRAR